MTILRRASSFSTMSSIEAQKTEPKASNPSATSKVNASNPTATSVFFGTCGKYDKARETVKKCLKDYRSFQRGEHLVMSADRGTLADGSVKVKRSEYWIENFINGTNQSTHL